MPYLEIFTKPCDFNKSVENNFLNPYPAPGFHVWSWMSLNRNLQWIIAIAIFTLKCRTKLSSKSSKLRLIFNCPTQLKHWEIDVKSVNFKIQTYHILSFFLSLFISLFIYFLKIELEYKIPKSKTHFSVTNKNWDPIDRSIEDP